MQKEVESQSEAENDKDPNPGTPGAARRILAKLFLPIAGFRFRQRSPARPHEERFVGTAGFSLPSLRLVRAGRIRLARGLAAVEFARDGLRLGSIRFHRGCLRAVSLSTSPHALRLVTARLDSSNA